MSICGCIAGEINEASVHRRRIRAVRGRVSRRHVHALTFDETNICTTNIDGSPSASSSCSSNGLYIRETCGDVPGVVDVTYSQPDQLDTRTLHWWADDFNELHGVAWADGGDGAGSHARIELQALGGPLALTHFDIGAYPHAQRKTIVDVYDLANTALPLFHYAGPVGALDHSMPFDFAFASSAGFRIDWQNSAYNVGIDNITFASAAAIPEPQTYAMVIAGLALLGFVTERRIAV